MEEQVQSCEGLDDPATDAALVERIGTGDQAALVELYGRYGRRVYPLIRRIVADESLAEEVLQDVFVRLWTRPRQYRPEAGQLAAWLMTVARNLSLDALRKEGRWRDLQELDESVVGGPKSGVIGAEGDLSVAVRHALSTLPAEQRRTVELAYFQGLTHEELAVHLDQPLGTVKSRLRLALDRLRRILGRTRDSTVAS